MIMNHPIHEANQDSPYGDLTREEFYKRHHIQHQQMFMINNHNMYIFTQTWCLIDSPSSYKGIVAMIHGYMSESSWLNELTAVAIAKAGFLVCALDLRGHGHSDGPPGYIPSIDPLVDDCIQYFDLIKSRNPPDLPALLYGESLGGAISILICLKQRSKWQGLILNGAMCGFAPAFKPLWPLERLLPIAKIFAKLLEMLLPTKKLVIGSKPMSNCFYKEKWKRTLVRKSPNRRRTSSAKPRPTTALEFLRVTEYIKSHAHEVDVPLLVLHGEDDRVCDFRSACLVYESASGKDKSLKIFSGMWHMLIGEPRENVELVFGTVLSWLKDHTDKQRQS